MDEREFELAEALTNRLLDAEYNRVQLELRLPVPEGFDGCCVTCGDEIPEGRLSTGAITCIPCQTKIELKRKLHI